MLTPSSEPPSAETETTVVVGDWIIVVETLLDGGWPVNSTPVLEFEIVGGVVHVEDLSL